MAAVNADNSAYLEITPVGGTLKRLEVTSVKDAEVILFDNPRHTVTLISPATMTRDADGVVVAVTGTNFTDGMTVDVGPELTASVVFNSSTSLTVTINTTGTPVVGPRPFLVTGVTGLTVSADDQAFTVELPAIHTITDFTPDTMEPGTDGFVVAVTGTNFTTGMTCDVGADLSAIVTYNSPTSLTVTIDTPGAFVIGPRPFSLTDTFGRTVFDDDKAFVVGMPTLHTVTSISPDFMLVGTSGNVFNVTGTDFTSTMTASAGAELTCLTVFNSPTSLTVTINTTGTPVESCRPLVITDIFGRGVSDTDQALDVRKSFPPTITSVTPSTLTIQGGSQQFDIVGTNFEAGTVVVDVPGAYALDFMEFNSSTSLTAYLLSDTVTPTTATLSVRESLYNQVGTWTGVIDVVLPAAPTITNVVPSFINFGTDDNIITVTGTNFVPGMTCDLGPNLATTFTYISPTSATVEVDTIVGVIEARPFKLTEPDFGQTAVWEDGAFFIITGVGVGSPPSVEDVFPAAGTSIRKNQPLSFFVGDNDDNALAEFITISFPGQAAEEVVWDASSFTSLYSGSSRTSTGNGHDYVIRRTGGWPGAPSLRIFAIDTFGNIL